ncbi:hypothetical protein [Sphingomonas sp.]|uniref:hypothetical protein n=1 Tax=Sphingomonas sp. TaxID=28214 RepID=UPI002DD6842F|nr:hypothetical protein [Sphingomonas sp.]
MRVLFYLPVVTPWWFDHIVTPLIRALASAHDVHVMVPPSWRGTGIDEPPSLARVTWHQLDAAGHPRLRDDGRAYPGLIDRITALSPDLTLARSADIVTPARFPGTVRYLMEASIPLIAPMLTRIQLADTLFDHGCTAPRPAPGIDDPWDRAQSDFPPREGPALPDGRRLIALALEFEHPEMFFASHRPYRDNATMIEAFAAMLPDDMLLAVTNHPANERFCDNSAIHAVAARHPGKVTIVPETGPPGRTTAMLARRADGMIVSDSKSLFLPAMFGTPVLRLSRFASGAWIAAYADPAAFFTDIAAGTARAADPADARAWIAHHLAHESFDAANPALDAATILSRANMPPLARAA